MWISHRKEIRKLTFRALAPRRSELQSSKPETRKITIYSFDVVWEWLTNKLNEWLSDMLAGGWWTDWHTE